MLPPVPKKDHVMSVHLQPLFKTPLHPTLQLSTSVSDISFSLCAFPLSSKKLPPSLTTGPRSTIRQVPDHQEVYLSATGFSSLIFDLGERVTHASTDEEALRYHFADIVDEKDTKKILSVDGSGRSVEVRHLPSVSSLQTLPPSPPPPKIAFLSPPSSHSVVPDHTNPFPLGFLPVPQSGSSHVQSRRLTYPFLAS